MVQPLVLPLKGVPNPRDLGGYISADGRKVKTHRLIRTGKMYNLPESDIKYLANYGVNQEIGRAHV